MHSNKNMLKIDKNKINLFKNKSTKKGKLIKILTIKGIMVKNNRKNEKDKRQKYFQRE